MTTFTLQNAESFVPASSAGVDDLGDDDDATFEHDGDNTDTGYIVGWNQILPANDADSFSVHVGINSSDARGFLPQAIRLIERDESAPHTQCVLVSTNRVVIPETSYKTFQTRLAIQPAGDTSVTVTKNSGDEHIVVSEGGSLVYSIADWDQWQTVTLWAGTDADDADGEAAIHCVVGSVTTLVTAVEDDDEDASGPVLFGASAPSATSVRIRFNEEVDLATAQTAGNYAMNLGVTVSSAVRDATDPSIVTLGVSEMTPATYRLTINHVEDNNSNAIQPNSSVDVAYSGQVTFYTNALDSDPDWPTMGLWEFGEPLGQGGSNDAPYGILNPDPTSGYTSTNVYGFNLAGNFEHADGETAYKKDFFLFSAAIDCSEYENVQLSFQRWLNIHGDRGIAQDANAMIEVSSDGSTWTSIWSSYPADVADDAWTNVSYDVSAVADGASTFYIRWGMEYLWGWWASSGWNIDDIEIEGTYVGGASSGGIEVSTSSVTVPEGGSNTFDLRLYSEPANAITVTVSHVSGDSDIQVQGTASFVFETNNWNSWQTATLQAAEDDSDWADGIATIRCSATDLENVDITATEDDNEADPTYSIPWEETFENDGTNAGTLGDLAGQHGWMGGGTVQTGTTQILSLQNATASHTFDGAQDDVIVEFDAKFVRGAATPSDVGTAVAIFHIDTNGYLVAYSNETPITLTSTNLSDDWHSFKAQLDYAAQTWDMTVDGALLVNDFAFYSAQIAFLKIAFTSGSEAAFFDEIYVTNNQGSNGDTDGDGIPDTWEDEHYNGITNAVATNLCANGINTILEAYIAGLNPTNANSTFTIDGIGNVLEWSGISGRVYNVYWTSNLLSGFSELPLTNLPWVPAVFTDTLHEAESKGFYKLEVGLE